MTESSIVVAPGIRWDRVGPVVSLLILLAGAFGLYWMRYHETSAERCQRIAWEMTVHDLTRGGVARTGQGMPSKPASARDRRWYGEHCYNGKPYE